MFLSIQYKLYIHPSAFPNSSVWHPLCFIPPPPPFFYTVACKGMFFLLLIVTPCYHTFEHSGSRLYWRYILHFEIQNEFRDSFFFILFILLLFIFIFFTLALFYLCSISLAIPKSSDVALYSVYLITTAAFTTK